MRLSNNTSRNVYLVKIKRPAMRRMIAIENSDRGNNVNNINAVIINAIRITGLRINNIISGMTILLGRRSFLLNIRPKHLTQRLIS